MSRAVSNLSRDASEGKTGMSLVRFLSWLLTHWGCQILSVKSEYLFAIRSLSFLRRVHLHEIGYKKGRSVSFYDHPRERVMRDGKDIQASHPRHLLL